MQLFLDTTDVAVLKDLAMTGLVDGVTTNPTLIAKSGRPMLQVIGEICAAVDGPVSAEVASTDFETMLAEGKYLATLAPNIAVKVPLTPAGFGFVEIAMVYVLTEGFGLSQSSAVAVAVLDRAVSVFSVIVIGAKLNAETEHQTARETTTGPEKPLGRRGAKMADTVGPARA